MGQVNATMAAASSASPARTGRKIICSALAKDLETRIIDLRRKFGEIGDTRLTVMAALMLGRRDGRGRQQADAAGGGNRRVCRTRAPSAAERAQAKPPPRSSARSIRRPSGSRASPASSTRPSPMAAGAGRTSHRQWRPRPPNHYIVPAGLRGALGDKFPGALRSLRELSLAGPVGSDIWRPPTYVGSRDHAPTAIAAPHSIRPSGNGRQHRLTAAPIDEQKPICARPRSRGAMRCRAAERQAARRDDRGARVSRADRAGHDRVRLHADEDRDQSAAADAQARRRGRAARAAGDRGPRQAADHARLCASATRSTRGQWGIREPKPDAPGSRSRHPDRAARRVRPRAATASAMAPATTT